MAKANETSCIFRDMQRNLIAKADALCKIQAGGDPPPPEDIVTRQKAYEQYCQELQPRDFKAFCDHKDALKTMAADEVEFLRALANVCEVLAVRTERGERLERPLAISA